MNTKLSAGLALFAVAILWGNAAGAEQEPPRVFCMSREGLLEARNRIARKDSALQASLAKLLEQADKALRAGPWSVMDKNRVPPSGNKHDFTATSPYAGTGDGLVNPAWWQDYDRVPLERLTQASETLALAYYLTGRQVYAERAAHLLRVWFLDPATHMAPDLKGRVFPGRDGFHEHWVSTIDVRFMSRIVDAVGLLGSSEAWTDEDQKGMVDWFRQFTKNVQARADAGHKNSGQNIATWYHAQIAAQALFVGDEALARELVERTKPRNEKAIGSDGVFLPERGRTRSMSYSCFNLYPMFNLAMMGERVGIDLWHYETADGRGMRLALDFLARYAAPDAKKNWPYKEIDPVEGDWWDPYRQMLPSVLYHAARVYEDKGYEAKAAAILQQDWATSRLHLICGIPVRWWDTVNIELPGLDD